MKRYIKNKLFVIGSILILIVLFLAIFAPIITKFDPVKIDTNNSLQPVSSSHYFGTDELGRDVFSRVIHGSRISLYVGFFAAIVSGIIGMVLGLFAGYYPKFDNVISRFVDGLLVFPGLIMAILIVSALGPSINNVIIAMVTLYTPQIIRVVRGSVVSIKNEDYIDAARVAGASDMRIIFIHILPNSLAPLIVQVTFGFAWAILVEAGISFLGLGMPPPNPSWGNIISDGRNFVYTAPWIMFFPGIAISLAVMGLNFIGDGLRDLTDSRIRHVQ